MKSIFDQNEFNYDGSVVIKPEKGRVTWGKMPPLSSIGHNFLYNWSIAYLARWLDTIQHTLSSTGPMICSTINKYVEYGNKNIF